MIKKFLLTAVSTFCIFSIGQIAQAHHGPSGHHHHGHRSPIMHNAPHHHMVRHHRPPIMNVYSGYRAYNPNYYARNVTTFCNYTNI